MRKHVRRHALGLTLTIVVLATPLATPWLSEGALTLDTSGCAATAIDFGAVVPAQDYTTAADCAIGFGTDSGDVQLRMYQQDGAGNMFVGVDDYAATTHDWTSDDDLFGACLRSISAVPVTGWGRPGDSSCDTQDSDPWNPIPTSTGSAGALVAEHTTGNYIASLRFGLRVEPGYAPGARSQGLVVEVVQPAPPPPINTVLPAITGTTTYGQVLTSDTGTWTGAVSYAYQWRRCNAAGASCADIAGQTASTYTLAAADVNQTIRVVVTATNGSGSTPATSTQTAVIAGVAPTAATASISGTTTTAQTLTASATGGWTTGTPAGSYSYQWRRCNSGGAACADIAGQTGSTYVLVAADVDQTIRVVITLTNSCTTGCGSANATSTQTAIIAGLPPGAGTASVTGINGYTQVLTAGNSGWNFGTPAGTMSYQWRRCDTGGASCVDIAGATSSTYTLVGADVGSTIRVVETVTNSCSSGCGSANATSAQTSVIQWIAPFAVPSTWATTNPTNLSVTKPAQVIPGHLLLAVVCVRDGTAQVITPPAGWTLLRRTDNSNRTALASYYRVADGSESGTITYSWSISRDATLGVYALSGVDNATPIDGSTGATGNSTTVTATGLTTTGTNETLIYAACIRSSLGAYSTPGGMTERWDYDAGGVSGASDIEEFAAAGATGTRSSTYSGAGAEWAAQLIALKRAP